MVFSSMTVFAKNNGRGKLSIDDMDLSKLKWIEEPKFGEVKNKKVEVYGKMQIPKEFKGTTIVKLEVNGFNVVPMKDGSFSKSIFINSEVNIKVFVGKDEVVDLGKTLIYLEDTTKVDKVEAMIEALPKVEDIKLNDKEAVRKARLAYEALTDMEKKAVKNLDKLIAAEKRIAELEQKEEKVKLTLLGEGLSSNPVAGEINKGTEVIVTAAVPKDKVVDKFIVNGANKKHMLVDNKYKFVIEKDTVIFVNYKEAEKGNVHIGLYKDSVVASNGIDFEYIIDSFYIENKETGERYTEGTSPWSAKRNY